MYLNTLILSGFSNSVWMCYYSPESESRLVTSHSLRPYGVFQAKILEWVAFPPPEDLPNPGIESRSPALHVDSLPAEPQAKPSYSPTQSFLLGF